ncbi:MAG: hypothetical protein WBB67_02775 [bacterium]
MELTKKKSSTYLLVKLSKADVKYLKDFKKDEHQKSILPISAE